jgi:hypothetical protein
MKDEFQMTRMLSGFEDQQNDRFSLHRQLAAADACDGFSRPIVG